MFNSLMNVWGFDILLLMFELRNIIQLFSELIIKMCVISSFCEEAVLHFSITF